MIPFKSAIKGYQEQEDKKITKWDKTAIRGLLRYFNAVEDKKNDYTGQLNSLFLMSK